MTIGGLVPIRFRTKNCHFAFNLSVGQSRPMRNAGNTQGRRKMNASILKTGSPKTGRKRLRIPAEVMALLSALQLSDADTTKLNALSDAHWGSLLEFCDIAHLTLAMAQLPSTGFPQWVRERLRVNLADNAMRFERVVTTYMEAAAALEQAGVEHIVIKGFTQAPDYVADPRLRRQGDLDIFCPPEKIDAAQRALQAIGYEILCEDVSLALADHGPTLVRTGNWKWKGNPFDPEMPLDIELHFASGTNASRTSAIPGPKYFGSDARCARSMASGSAASAPQIILPISFFTSCGISFSEIGSSITFVNWPSFFTPTQTMKSSGRSGMGLALHRWGRLPRSLSTMHGPGSVAFSIHWLRGKSTDSRLRGIAG